MKSLNPELESQVDALAELCCNILQGQENDSSGQAQPLLQALVHGGYARLSDVNLQTRLESRAVEKCREKAIHRRGELAAIAGQMQQEFEALVKWKTQTPRPPEGTQPANISSATDA
ncbi:MAG: hypothetical protein KDA45_16385 [Planctomycetales bacterium]|nr:hypothetical protein [Planctomycetales bacterium]